eukprot:scaffold4482_cov393-Prasinococcus_capsulatus_cf.AAC.5
MANLHGLPQVVRERASDVILTKAKHGLRVIGVAVSEDEGTSWRLLGTFERRRLGHSTTSPS